MARKQLGVAPSGATDAPTKAYADAKAAASAVMPYESDAGVFTTNSGATNLANFNAWAIANSGKPIFIRAGIYDFTGTLVPKGSIYGAGPGVTVLRFPEQSVVSIQPVFWNDIVFSDFEIRSTSTATYDVPGTIGSVSSHHLIMETGTGFLLRNLYANGGAVMGIHVRNAHRGAIENCKVYNTVRDGIHITNGSTDISVVGNQVIHTGDDGIALITYNEDSFQNERITVTGNTVYDSPRARGIVCEGGKDIVISSNSVTNISGVGGILLNTIGANPVTDVWTLTNVLCANNVIENVFAGDGIHINGKIDGLVADGNIIRNVSSGGIRVNNGRVVIQNNFVDQTGSTSISAITATCSYSVFKNNICKRSAVSSIYIDTGTDVVFSGNIIQQPNTDGTSRDAVTIYNTTRLQCTDNRIEGTTGTLTSGIVISVVTDSVVTDNYVTNYSGASTFFNSCTNIQTDQGTKVSALPAAASAALTTEIPVNEAGTTKKITVDQILATDSLYSSVYGASVATQAPAVTDTYITGSRLLVPATSGRGALKIASQYRFKCHVSKTAAGVVAPIFTLRFGTAGTTADGSVGAITFAAQTAVIDEGLIELFCTWITVGTGTTATMRPMGTLVHRLAATGLSTSGSSCILGAVGAGHNSQLASAGIGVSVTSGTAAAWTLGNIQAELYNLV